MSSLNCLLQGPQQRFCCYHKPLVRGPLCIQGLPEASAGQPTSLTLSCHPPILQSCLSCTRAPMSCTGHYWMPAWATSHHPCHASWCPWPADLTGSSRTVTRAVESSPAEADEEKGELTDPPDPVQPTLTSTTICSGGHGPRRALGQKQPAPGRLRAGLQGILVRRPGWPSRCSCQHGWATGVLGYRHRLSLTEVPGMGDKRGPCDLRGRAEAPSVCHPLRDEHCGWAEQEAPLMPRYSLAFMVPPRALETSE